MSEEGGVTPENPRPVPADLEPEDMCWICLDDTKDKDPLVSPCKCPRKVHPRCLARWQLQQAGRLEETNCRFCQCNLADWKASLTPENLKPDVQRVQPIMVVYFEGQIHRIPVKQGSDGLKEFTHRIRELFRLPEDVDISLTFGCKEPMSGQHLKLEGIGAFDAAVHCASVAAAERQQKLKSGGGAPTGPSGGGAAGAAAPAEGAAAGGSGGAGQLQPQHAGLARTYTAPPQPNHRYQHLPFHQQQQQLRTVSGGSGSQVSDPASAPTSAQGSDGGASSGSTIPQLLQPAASAPALSHYGYEHAAPGHAHPHLQSHPQLSSHAATPSHGHSYPSYGSISDEPASTAHSARTSSGGGARSAGANTAGGGAVSLSPFQSAVYGGLVTHGSPEAASGAPILRTQATAPEALGRQVPLAQGLLADAISEPGAARLAPATPGGNRNGTSFAPLSSFLQQHQQPYQPQQQVHQQSPCGPPPYAAAPGQAPPALPPLSPVSGGRMPSRIQADGGAVTPCGPQAPGRASWPSPALSSLSPSSPMSGQVPPTPRDHYHARPPHFHTHHYPGPLYYQGQQHHHHQQQQRAVGGGSSGSASPGSGPATPVRPVVRRPAGSPTTPPPPPLLLPAGPALASPTSPTGARHHHHHPYHPDEEARVAAAAAAAAMLGPLHAGLLASPTAAEYGNGGAAAANRRPRPTLSSPRSDFGSAMPSPTADDPALGGSLTGRLKYSLRAFSRKVARSLTFQRGALVGGPGSANGTPFNSPRPMGLSPEAEAEVAEAGAEAEVGTAGGRYAECGGAAVAASTAPAAVAAFDRQH